MCAQTLYPNLFCEWDYFGVFVTGCWEVLLSSVHFWVESFVLRLLLMFLALQSALCWTIFQSVQKTTVSLASETSRQFSCSRLS